MCSRQEEYARGAWEEIIGRCEEVGVDAFEINFSCPHGMPERRMGMAMGQDCEVRTPDPPWCLHRVCKCGGVSRPAPRRQVLTEVCGWINAAATKPVWRAGPQRRRR